MNQSMTRRGFMVGAVSLSVLPLSGGNTAHAQSKSVLRYRVFIDMQVLDPPFRLTAPEGDVITAIFPKLVSFDPGDKWQWRPDAAEEIEQVDDTHIRFKVRPGMQWTGDFGQVRTRRNVSPKSIARWQKQTSSARCENAPSLID
ncbi:MAG: hypothetical protein L0210_06860, partial [Rhodospirillales bacterium]|nr:hypothetical protein [Rhodospirillales bacterium]